MNADMIFSKFNKEVKKDSQDVVNLCNYFVRVAPYEIRLQILHFLFGIANADGRVSEEEVSKIESFISNKFNFSEDERNFAINIFQKAKSDSVSFEAYAKQLYQLLGSSPNSLLVFYELLFELAMADGEMHENEERLLRKIPNIFGFNKNVYKDLYNKYVGNISNAYEILGVTKSMTLEEIKKVYRVKRKEFHPDALISKGLPEELIEKAKEKFI